MNYIVENFAIIATILLTAAVGAHFLWRNNFKTRRANACVAFRYAVLAELGSLYPNPAPWPSNIDEFLSTRFVALQIAVENFRPFVPWWSRWRFDRAWFRYRCATGRKIDTQCYLHYFDSYDPLTSTQAEETKKCREIFHDNVELLLSYAKET